MDKTKPFKLYIKITCNICQGKNLGCFYCDEQSKSLIEASDKKVAEWLKQLPEEDKKLFRRILEDV